MRATVNGEPLELPDGLTVAALLRHLGVRAERWPSSATARW